MKNISIVLNEFLIQQNLNDELCADYKPHEDSYYQSSDQDDIPSLVVLGGLSVPRADELYMDYCNELGLEIPMHVETMSFLHEVGHHITMEFLDEDEVYESEIIKMNLYMRDEECDETFIEYFKCPDEHMATLDAVKFCNACPEVARRLDADIQEALYGI